MCIKVFFRRWYCAWAGCKKNAGSNSESKRKNDMIQRTMPFCVRENGLIIPRPKASVQKNAMETSRAYEYASVSGLRAQAWACASVLRYASASGLRAQAYA